MNIQPINITIVYALKNKQYVKKMKLKYKISVEEAILRSNIINSKTINIYNKNVGIYGNIVNLSDFIKNGDRIEIYRPLLIDPRELRRKKIMLHKKNILKDVY
ncbi:MAG: RnfH family protein [Buchnera aphidicola (Schlechtendalia peitan)]